MSFRPNVHDELTLNRMTCRMKNHQVTKTQSFLSLRAFVVRKKMNHQVTKTPGFSLPFVSSCLRGEKRINSLYGRKR